MRKIFAATLIATVAGACGEAPPSTVATGEFDAEGGAVLSVEAPKLAPFFPAIASPDGKKLHLSSAHIERLKVQAAEGNGFAIETLDSIVVFARKQGQIHVAIDALGPIFCDLAERERFPSAAKPCIRWLVSSGDPRNLDRAAKLTNWLAGTRLFRGLLQACSPSDEGFGCIEGGSVLWSHPDVVPLVQALVELDQELAGASCFSTPCVDLLIAAMDRVALREHLGALRVVLGESIIGIGQMRFRFEVAKNPAFGYRQIAEPWRAWSQAVRASDAPFADHLLRQAKCVESVDACRLAVVRGGDARFSPDESLDAYDDVLTCRLPETSLHFALKRGYASRQRDGFVECLLKGESIPQNFEMAERFAISQAMRRAPMSTYALATIYGLSQFGLQDLEASYFALNLAGDGEWFLSHLEINSPKRQTILRQLTSRQIARAQRRSSDWSEAGQVGPKHLIEFVANLVLLDAVEVDFLGRAIQQPDRSIGSDERPFSFVLAERAAVSTAANLPVNKDAYTRLLAATNVGADVTIDGTFDLIRAFGYTEDEIADVLADVEIDLSRQQHKTMCAADESRVLLDAGVSFVYRFQVVQTPLTITVVARGACPASH